MGLVLLTERHGKQIAGVLSAANRRYLELLSAIDDPSNGIDKLNKITRTVHEQARSYRGGEPLLQVLPDRTRQTGCRAGPQTQGAFYHSGARRCALTLISNSCHFRQEPNYH
jgi:hypothetical protein